MKESPAVSLFTPSLVHSGESPIMTTPSQTNLVVLSWFLIRFFIITSWSFIMRFCFLYFFRSRTNKWKSVSRFHQTNITKNINHPVPLLRGVLKDVTGCYIDQCDSRSVAVAAFRSSSFSIPSFFLPCRFSKTQKYVLIIIKTFVKVIIYYLF